MIRAAIIKGVCRNGEKTKAQKPIKDNTPTTET
jgi:hypothetical protein